MFKIAAFVFATFFILWGILGLVPPLNPYNELFGLFKVNLALNIFHIITGACALWVAFLPTYYIRLYFQIVGFVYIVIALLGVLSGEKLILNLLADNMANTLIHAILAIAALILGFRTRDLKQ